MDEALVFAAIGGHGSNRSDISQCRSNKSSTRPLIESGRSKVESRDQALLALRDAGLAGDGLAMRKLVEEITPVVRARVLKILQRRAYRARGRDLKPDTEDFVQDVFAALFAHDGRAMRAWDKARGLSFLSFVGLLAEREVGMKLRTAKRNPWTEDPTTTETLDQAIGSTECVETYLESRDVLCRLLSELRNVLTPEGRHYFQALYIDGRSVREAALHIGTTADALYAWRSRLAKRMRRHYRR